MPLHNEILDALARRKSVRVFTDAPVTGEERAAILEAAFQAPTAGCQQLYTILDITDPALRARLADLCDHQPMIAAAPLCLIFLADCRRWPRAYRAAGAAPRDPGPGDLLLAVADACIAAQNAVTAAESLGIGSCYIGDVLENAEAMRRALDLPAHVVPAAMLIFGRPTPQQKTRPKPRRFAAGRWSARTPTRTAPKPCCGPTLPPGKTGRATTLTPTCKPSAPASMTAISAGR